MCSSTSGPPNSVIWTAFTRASLAGGGSGDGRPADPRTIPPDDGGTMSLTVVGSIAFDAVRTPFGERERMLGGSAVHFSLAAALLHRGAGGRAGRRRLRRRRVRDAWRAAGSSATTSSGWRAARPSSGAATTSSTSTPPTPTTPSSTSSASSSRSSRRPRGAAEMLFLANIQPDLQRQVRAQCEGARFAALDSMNLWIETARDSLLAAIAEVDCLIINDAEIRQLTGEPNLARAARAVMDLGPRAVVAKQGEYGAALFTAIGLLRPARLPARGRPRPDRRRRQLRRRLPRLPRRRRRGDRRRGAAAGDGLRHRARLLQRRGVRHRAGRAAHPRGDRRAHGASCAR